MHIKVLGAGAGGGLPQWNCNAKNSRDARNGHEDIKPRSQSSIAISRDGNQWVLLNASPDIRQQIFDNPQLHPKTDGPPRSSPIEAVVLTNGDVDHIAGLLCLREGHAFNIYAAERVINTLNANSIFNVLNPEKVKRHTKPLGKPFEIEGPSGPLGLTITPFAVPGKVALYLEDQDKANGQNFGTEEGDTIGLFIEEIDQNPATEQTKSFFYIPGCAALDDTLKQRITGANLIFFDGTLYTNTEMLDQGLLPKTGERMGHMNMSGENGSLQAFQNLAIKQKIYIHINNSNPVLRENSKERTTVEAAGWQVAYDGMEVNI